MSPMSVEEEVAWDAGFWFWEPGRCGDHSGREAGLGRRVCKLSSDRTECEVPVGCQVVSWAIHLDTRRNSGVRKKYLASSAQTRSVKPQNG